LKGNCLNNTCKCAHVTQEVLNSAIDRKNSAFEKRAGEKAVVSSRGCSRENADFDNSLQEADDEVARLTCHLSCISFGGESHRDFSSTTGCDDDVGCGGWACARFLEKPSQHPCSGETNSETLLDIFEGLFMEPSQHHLEQPVPPLPSAPLLVHPSVGNWDEVVDPKTGLSYYRNSVSGEISMDNPVDMISNTCVAFACQALAEQCSVSSVVACQALAEQCSVSSVVARRRKVVQNDASVAPKASKRLLYSQSEQCSASSVVARRRKVVQNDASVAPKASKKLLDSQSEQCSASSVVARRRKVVQNDTSVAPKASKRLLDSQSEQNCSKKGNY